MTLFFDFSYLILFSLKVFPQVSNYRILTEHIVIHTNVKILYNHYYTTIFLNPLY